MTKAKKELSQVDKLEKQRQFTDALKAIQEIVRINPTDFNARLKLADLLQRNKQFKPAIQVYTSLNETTLKEGKSDLKVMIGLANSLLFDNQLEQAERLFRDIGNKIGKHADILTGIGSVKRRQEKYTEAEPFIDEALQLSITHQLANYEKAQLEKHLGEDEKAIKRLEKNIKTQDPHGDSIDLWLNFLAEKNRDRYAQDVLEALAEKYPKIIEFNYGYAVLANKAGEITLARPAFEKALSVSPENARLNYELGVLERVAGNMDRSSSLIKKALELNPDSPSALRTYMSDIKYEYGDENFKRLNYVAARFSDFSPFEQVHLHYALAKCCEDVGELNTAFRHYEYAGRKKRETVEFDEKASQQMAAILQKVVNKENLSRSGWKGYNSEVPVFILGMPRSGTSLMEQILSAHPDIFGAGELKFMTGVLENIQLYEGTRLKMGDKDPVFPYDQNASWEDRGKAYVERVKKLADKSDYKRIVDKMPGNYNFVGLIQAVLPNAKIIHSRRHPVETCLSCYRIHFAEGHQWTYNLRELGRAYRRYWNVMKHWRDSFPGLMYEVRYEDNVNDVEASARKLIDFLELEWNDNCLEFYNVDRPVKTASVEQVRKPIYKSSTNRWRKYEEYLQPLLDEIGDIVEEYEAEIEHLIEK